MSIKRVLRELAQKNEGNLACHLINIELALRSRHRISYSPEKCLYYTHIPGKEGVIYGANAYSLGMRVMRNNIIDRAKQLAEKYSLDTVDISDGDTVIDVGANIGEIGLYFTLVRGMHKVRYYALEPMEKEMRACQLNNPNGMVFQQALWEEDGEFTFYQETRGRNDSSFIEPVRYDATKKMRAMTLKSFVNQQKLEKIKVLKVETEGGEPEVIRGCVGVLDRIAYIAADLGPERGPNIAYTVPEVANFLHKHGFEMAGMNKKTAKNYFFKNTKYG